MKSTKGGKGQKLQNKYHDTDKHTLIHRSTIRFRGWLVKIPEQVNPHPKVEPRPIHHFHRAPFLYSSPPTIN